MRNWPALDQSLSQSLRDTATCILAETPPVRVTLAELERRLGQPGWIGKRQAKLPLTVATLSIISETTEAFQLRRIAWARDELERTESSAPAWKIHRLAGLPERMSPAVRDALTIAARP